MNTPLQIIQKRSKELNAFELGCWIKENIEHLLAEERNNIVEAYNDGYESAGSGEDGDKYFNDAFTNQNQQ